MTKKRYIVAIVILFLLQIVLLKSLSLSTLFFLAPAVYLVLSMERGISPIKGMVLLFLVGMAIDLFSMGIPGLWSASLLAASVPRLLIIKERAWESDDDLYDMPSLKEMGASRYVFFAITVNVVFFSVYVILEKMSISLLSDIVRIVLSSLLNTVLMVILALISQPKRRTR